MNPNLNYGELNRGIKQINPSGIMAGRNITDILESIHLIKYSNLWTEMDQKEIISWFEKYLNWLLYSDAGEKKVRKLTITRLIIICRFPL